MAVPQLSKQAWKPLPAEMRQEAIDRGARIKEDKTYYMAEFNAADKAMFEALRTAFVHIFNGNSDIPVSPEALKKAERTLKSVISEAVFDTYEGVSWVTFGNKAGEPDSTAIASTETLQNLGVPLFVTNF